MKPNKENAAPAEPKKKWHVGTLTYTSGGLIVLFCWLLFGDFAWMMRERSVTPMSQWFLSSLNIPNVLFGLILSSFPAVLGVTLGPIISVKSDRHRGPWGRRIPFLLLTTPFAVVGMIGIALTPVISGWIHESGVSSQNEWVVSVGCFAVFWAAFEFASIAGQAVFGGLINDVVPKNMLGRFYGVFRAVSLIDGMIFNYWIMGHVPNHFTVILILIALFYAAAFTLVCFKVKEGEYPPPPPRDAGAGRILQNAWRETKGYARECFANPYYLSIFLLLMFASLGFSSVNIFAMPYAKSLGIEMTTYGEFLALTYAISLCLAYPLGWLSDLLHPLRMALFSLGGYLLVTTWGVFWADTQSAFLCAWVMHGVLAGCFLTTSASLGNRLFPHASFAQYFSAAHVLNSGGAIMIGPVVGLIIDQSGNIYRNTFGCAAAFTLMAIATGIFVYRRFLRYGGTRNYEAP